MFKVKTIDKPLYYSSPPNGGWGWVVMVAAFCVYGNAFGISKSLGIYFLDMKFEFGVSNSETSWITSLFVGAIQLGGLFTSILSTWMDARKLIMSGGLLSCCGMVLSAFSPDIWPVYLGSVLAGTGHGIAFITVTAQISLYFTTLRPLATGIMMSGSSIISTISPYINQYLLENYGWRGSFLILAAVCLNTCVMGALIRPIEIVHSRKTETVALQQNGDTKTLAVNERISRFLFTYWVALCLLFVSFIFVATVYVPNVYLVPYAQALGYSSDDATLLLSLISIGDIICRPLNGFLIAHFQVLLNNILLYIAALFFLISLDQLLAVFSLNFAILVVYTILHGCLLGSIVTSIVIAIPTLMGTKNISKVYGIYFAAGSIPLCASAPLAGIFVDAFNDYSVAYWYCVIGYGATGICCFVMYVIVKARGGTVSAKKITTG